MVSQPVWRLHQVSGVSVVGRCSRRAEVGVEVEAGVLRVLRVSDFHKKVSEVLIHNLVSVVLEDRNLVWDFCHLRKCRQCHPEYFVLN